MFINIDDIDPNQNFACHMMYEKQTNKHSHTNRNEPHFKGLD